MTKTYSKTRVLVECALMIAVGTVLANIKIYTPQRRQRHAVQHASLCADLVPAWR